MKPQEALNLLDSAIAQLQADRQTHIRLQEAVSILSKFIQSKDEVKQELNEDKK